MPKRGRNGGYPSAKRARGTRYRFHRRRTYRKRRPASRAPSRTTSAARDRAVALRYLGPQRHRLRAFVDGTGMLPRSMRCYHVYDDPALTIESTTTSPVIPAYISYSANSLFDPQKTLVPPGISGQRNDQPTYRDVMAGLYQTYTVTTAKISVKVDSEYIHDTSTNYTAASGAVYVCLLVLDNVEDYTLTPSNFAAFKEGTTGMRRSIRLLRCANFLPNSITLRGEWHLANQGLLTLPSQVNTGRSNDPSGIAYTAEPAFRILVYPVDPTAANYTVRARVHITYDSIWSRPEYDTGADT